MWGWVGFAVFVVVILLIVLKARRLDPTPKTWKPRTPRDRRR